MVTLLRKFIGDPSEKAVDKIGQAVAPAINALENRMQGRSDVQLLDMTGQFRDRLAGAKHWTTCSRKPLPLCGKWPAATWGSAIMTCSLSAAWCCTGARLPK